MQKGAKSRGGSPLIMVIISEEEVSRHSRDRAAELVVDE